MSVWFLPTRLRPVDIIALPLLFGLIGLLFGAAVTWDAAAPTEDHAYPLPHHIPTYPGNLTLRFAMVHDMIHDRFPRHGAAYYRARNQAAQKALEKLQPTQKGAVAAQYFQHLDDLGVGLEFLGEHQAAVDLMRDKLNRQESLGYQGRDLYSTYANLGTFLILWQLSEGVNDVPTAKKRIGESVQWIHKAIEVYPESHFGREKWQVVLEEFLLAILDKPELLLQFDMIGNRLDQPLEPSRGKCCDENGWKPRQGGTLAPAKRAEDYLQAPDAGNLPLDLRAFITRVGAGDGWARAVKTSHVGPVPFDEPTLGIVGMWRMGAGANPHFALALGEIMVRIGQRYVAWTAYERAYRLADHFSPAPKVRDAFAAHCKARQHLIEEGLPDEDWHAVRARFDKELLFGQKYQKDYQDYETARLAQGTALDDPHFYDDFDANHAPVATPVGAEDVLLVTRELHNSSRWLGASPFAGLFAFLAAFAVWLLLRRHHPPCIQISSSGKELRFFSVWFVVLMAFFTVANLAGAIKWVGERGFRFTGFPFTFAQWGGNVDQFLDWQLLFLNTFVALGIAGALAWILAWDRCRWMAAHSADNGDPAI